MSLNTSSTLAPIPAAPALTDSTLAFALLETSLATFTASRFASFAAPLPFSPISVVSVGFTFTMPTPIPTPARPPERPISRPLPVVEDLPRTFRLPAFPLPVFCMAAPPSTAVSWFSSLRTMPRPAAPPTTPPIAAVSATAFASTAESVVTETMGPAPLMLAVPSIFAETVPLAITPAMDAAMAASPAPAAASVAARILLYL